MGRDRPVQEAENRLEHFNHDRERLLAEVERRVSGRLIAGVARGHEHSLEYVLNDVCYSEIRRLEASGGGPALDRWRDLSRRLIHMSEAEKRRELQELVAYYARDIVGNFDPRVYRVINEIGPKVLGFWFSPVGSLREGVAALGQLDSRIRVDGELELARRCAERGTLVVTPTHTSNMDSVVIGLALARAGLPPVTYGAGKNLFTNPLISFFMRNLGAYRVDRRLRFELYKDVLKEYSTVLLENGYHSLFFPGGTRCRSNVVEKNLKLGLLGTTVTSLKERARQGHNNSRVYVVPATINYRLVLEAATLIDDYLAETGKNRYIITDDEFSRVGRIIEFVRKTLSLEGAVVIRFGRPLDPFGNEIDDDGESIDRAGRRLDPMTYLRGADGEVSDDDQRDAEYTRTLGRKLAATYPSLTVFHSTNVLARALYDRVAANAGTRDIYRLLRAPATQLMIKTTDVVRGVELLRAQLGANAALGQLHPHAQAMTTAQLIEDAVHGFGTYHTRPIVERHGDRLVVDDLKLLYYYQNRTSHIPVVAETPNATVLS